MLEGDHLLSHWLKVGQTLMQSNRSKRGFRLSSLSSRTKLDFLQKIISVIIKTLQFCIFELSDCFKFSYSVNVSFVLFRVSQSTTNSEQEEHSTG